MAKRLLFFAVGALALTACTSTDVPDDNASTRKVIRFENVVKKPTRGAEELTAISLNSFNVFGFYTMPDDASVAHAIFDDETATKVGDVWTTPGVDRFWLPGVEYHFYAYSCNNSNLNENFGTFDVDMEKTNMAAENRTLTIKDYKCDKDHQHDLLFAYSKCKYPDEVTNDAVALEFKHILTKLSAQFTNTFSGEYEVVVKDVKVENICNTGNYNSATGWVSATHPATNDAYVNLLDAGKTLTVESKKKTFPDKTAEQVKEATELMSDIAFVIPHEYKASDTQDVKITFTIDVVYKDTKDQENVIDHVILENKDLTATITPNWKEGYYYIYTFDLNPKTIHMNQISFTVTEISGFKTPEEGEENTNPNID